MPTIMSNMSPLARRSVVLACVTLTWCSANAQTGVTTASSVPEVPDVITSDSLERLLTVLDERRESVSAQMWKQVGRLVCDEHVHPTARSALLIRMELGPADAFAETVRGVRASAKRPAEPGAVDNTASLELAVMMLLRADASPIYRSSPVEMEVWSLAREAAESKWADFEAVPTLARIIAEWPAEPPARSLAAYALIKAYGDTMDLTGWSIFDVLQQPEIDRLSATLRNATLTFAEFPRGALAAAVTRGDSEFIAYLEAAALRCSPESTSGAAVDERQGYRYLAQTLAASAQLIRTQSDGGELLRWGTLPGAATPELRVWALLKARRLGVADSAIREAVLAYAGLVQDQVAKASTVRSRETVISVTLRERVAPLKQGMIEAGVMTQGDLPGVNCVPSDLHDRAFLRVEQR